MARTFRAVSLVRPQTTFILEVRTARYSDLSLNLSDHILRLYNMVPSRRSPQRSWHRTLRLPTYYVRMPARGQDTEALPQCLSRHRHHAPRRKSDLLSIPEPRH